MPIELVSDLETPASEAEDAYLTESGRMTLEAEVLASFLNTVDFSPLFDDADARQFVTDEVLPVAEDEFGRLLPLDEDEEETPAADEGTMKPKQEPKPPKGKVPSSTPRALLHKESVGEMEFESIPGDIAIEFIDEADLSAMLEYYLKYEYPSDTLEDRTALGCFADILEGDSLEEWKAPFKKGDFRKGPMQGISAKSKGVGKKVYGQRVRMMSAMMKKGVIKRVKAGTGYKGGDYTRGAGYPKGTPAGQSAYGRMAQKSHRNPGNISKYVDPGRRKVVQLIYKNIGSSMPKSWVPPEKRHGGIAKTVKKITIKKDKAAAISKGKALFKGKGKAMDLSHKVDASYTLHEGAGLAGAVAAAGARQQSLLTPSRLEESLK